MLDYDTAPAAIMVLRQMLQEGTITFDKILDFGHRAGIDEKHVEGLEADLADCVRPRRMRACRKHIKSDRLLELD